MVDALNDPIVVDIVVRIFRFIVFGDTTGVGGNRAYVNRKNERTIGPKVLVLSENGDEGPITRSVREV